MSKDDGLTPLQRKLGEIFARQEHERDPRFTWTPRRATEAERKAAQQDAARRLAAEKESPNAR